MNPSQRGFTIVELLIAVVVIGILASITVVGYNGVQTRANDAVVKTDLRNAYNQVEVQAVANGKYPEYTSAATSPTGGTDFDDIDIGASIGSYDTTIGYNYIYCAPYPYGTESNFAFVGQSKSGTIFIHNKSGSSTYEGGTTLNDYVTLCVELTDEEGVFSGDYNEPNLRVTTAGFYRDRTPQWQDWAIK